MSKKLQLQIPEPCHEDWNKMAPVDKGRFCDSCQKTVHDFTGMNDAQLIAFFKKPSTGSLCGRFLDDQLGRNIEIPRKRIPWVKYFFQFTIPIFLTSLKGQSQVNLSLKERTCSPAFTNEKGILRGMVGAVALYNDSKIFGQVIDEKGSGIPYASVYIKGTTEGTTCDSSGFFEIGISRKEKKISLLVSSIGFSSAEKEINLKKDNFTKIVLTINAFINKEVVVIAYGTVGKLVTTTGSVATVKGQMSTVKEVSFLQKMKDLFTSRSIKLYPNPVSRSQQVSIEFESAKTEKISIRLFSLDGKLVGMKEYKAVEGANRVSYSINTELTAGAYAIQIINGNGKVIKTDKLIIQ
jgi:CarboxypepD_reg-like domain/Secretion system C-terminal sorting domain